MNEITRPFPEIKKIFGFGMMRLPMLGNEVDTEQVSKMVDAFIDNGFNYFDTAHGYINGLSELAVKECLSSRYDRSEFLLTDKLTSPYFKKREDIRPFLKSQLDACGVDYFDFYLMHAQNKSVFESFKQRQAYEEAFELKKEGLVKHVGISFHDRAEVLDEILTEYPEIEIVQIQFNYLDYYDDAVDSRRVYEVVRKHNKPIIVMEPVKGGSLVNLPPKADTILKDLKGGSNASYALRYVGSFEGIEMILSGMSDMDQMIDNILSMKDFKPLDEKEMSAIDRVREEFNSLNMIPCTGCKYCIEENHCPKNILIPDLFSCMNKKKAFNDWNQEMYYNDVVIKNGAKPEECLQCGLCEKVCPQGLHIRELLKEVAAEFA